MPTSPPLLGVLLARLPGPDDGTGLNDAKEWWYDPTTRTAALYNIEDTADFTLFQLPSTTIIDRWCVSPGIAPYTEIRVTPNFNGHDVVLTPYDNVTSCMVVCTIQLVLTPTAMLNGRADVLATAPNAQGTVVFTIDDFDTPGVVAGFESDGTPSHLFTDLRPGTYTITVRETRPGGCTATQTIKLTATYAPRYEAHFKDLDSEACLLRVWQREYGGDVEELDAQEKAVLLDWPGDPTGHVYTDLLRGSQCQLALYLMRDEQLQGLFSGDERLHRVEYSRAGSLKWAGYLLPEQYDVAFLPTPSVFNLSATDGLGTLSDVPFLGPAGQALRGDWTVLQIVLYCLGKLDLGLPLHTLDNLYPGSATLAAPALEQIRLDVAQYREDKGEPWTCGQVLDAILQARQARLYQQDGAWWFERLIELTTGELSYVAYSASGVSSGTVSRTLLESVTPPSDRPCWIDDSQRQSLRGAVAKVSLPVDAGAKANLLYFTLPSNDDLTAGLPSGWLDSTSTPGVPFRSLVYEGKDKTPILRLIGTAGPVNGYPNTAASTAAGLAAPWVQTRVIPPVPLPLQQAGDHILEGLVLRFTAKPYGNTPNLNAGKFSFMTVAVHYGNAWLTGTSGFPESPTPFLIGAANFDTTQETEVSIPLSTLQLGPKPLYVRFYAPIGGDTATTVDITDLELNYEVVNDAVIADAYTDEYRASTGLLVSRVDTGRDLFHSDTPNVRRQGTWLDAGGLPVHGWYEPATPGQLREVGDYATRDRVRWQNGPAQVLTGLLRGQIAGPGTLLTDPGETTPAVYLLPSLTHDAAAATWQVTGVQLRNLTAPVATLPNYAIYYEDAVTAWTDAAGIVLTYDHA